MSKTQVNKRKIFNDPVYGFITIPGDRVFDIIEHPVFSGYGVLSSWGWHIWFIPGRCIPASSIHWVPCT